VPSDIVLVVGATGLLGSRICRRLASRGVRVRALVRPDSPGLVDLRATAVELIDGDLTDHSSLERACVGASAVVTTANAVRGRLPGDNLLSVDLRGQRALLDAARAAGVGRFVYVSVSPKLAANNPFVRYKRDMEQAVRESGLVWTILQPTMFMEIHLGPMLGWDYAAGRSRILGSPDVARSYISADDVADFAARAVDATFAANRQLYLAGPESLTPGEAVTIAERIAGRRFKVQRIPAPVLMLASVLLRPLKPIVSSLLRMAASTNDELVDMTPLATEFDVRLTPFADYVRARLAAHAAHPSAAVPR
jgi:uncharacterized protein YbjT (DUF2867 family)